MYAIVRSGGQQQKVAVGDVIEIDKVAHQVGDSVTLPVLMLVDGENVTAGADALSDATVTAEVLGATDIFIGVNALDYSGYPDCRPEYIAAYERMANLATRGGVVPGAAVNVPVEPLNVIHDASAEPSAMVAPSVRTSPWSTSKNVFGSIV